MKLWWLPYHMGKMLSLWRVRRRPLKDLGDYIQPACRALCRRILAETLSSGNVEAFLVTVQQSLKNVTDVQANTLVPELLEISDQVLMPSWQRNLNGITGLWKWGVYGGHSECIFSSFPLHTKIPNIDLERHLLSPQQLQILCHLRKNNFFVYLI